MTEHRPPACHYDRALAQRVTREHCDDCPKGNDCPGDHGCAPCTAPHCQVCGREHATNDHPQTCPTCQGKIDQDLLDIRAAYALLATEALEAGGDGQLVAAAPIPGGNAAVMIGPTVRLNMLRTYGGWTADNFAKDHRLGKDQRSGDPLPPLAVLARWEDLYRAWLGHDRDATPTKTARWGDPVTSPRRATIGRAIAYLRDQLPYLAQRSDGPDFVEFTRQVRHLRAACEHQLHDEREAEQGVECFECGDRLVRRIRAAARCTCGPRPVLEHAAHGHCTCAAASRIERPDNPDHTPVIVPVWDVFPEAGHVHPRDDLSCIACHRETEWETQHAGHAQGGVDDPRASMSWECPGCRKDYDPQEYAHAVRRSLLDSDEGMGWCTLPTAAEAASEITGRPITAATIRTWATRGDNIGVVCRWLKGQRFGVQLVYWPDVAQRVTETRRTGPRRRSA